MVSTRKYLVSDSVAERFTYGKGNIKNISQYMKRIIQVMELMLMHMHVCKQMAILEKHHGIGKLMIKKRYSHLSILGCVGRRVQRKVIRNRFI